MIDTWNPAKLNEKISGCDSWNSAILNEAVTDRDSWNPAILNESAGDTPVEFEATITVTFPEGATVTCSDGTTTLTADDNPMAFNIPNEGTWAVACVANGVTFSENVVITTNGQTETVDLTPVGETVIPTDSVPMLIACAGIGDSTYTTISDVIADSDLLEEITTNDNTIAYLVRSTTFAATMVADEDTMAAIGASNGCSDALLSDSTWLNAICNSAYFNKVLNTSNPTMTSNTTPAGNVASVSDAYEGIAYQIFDNNDITKWLSMSNNPWAKLELASPFAVNRVMLKYADVTRSDTLTLTIAGSNDDVTYTTINTVTTNLNSNNQIFAIMNSASYKYYKFTWNGYLYVSGQYNARVATIQFYGRADV